MTERADMTIVENGCVKFQTVNMDALSDYKYLCTNIKNAGNVIAFPAFFHIFAFKERKSLQDILECEEALCLSCRSETEKFQSTTRIA